jgi:hypothetical protein
MTIAEHPAPDTVPERPPLPTVVHLNFDSLQRMRPRDLHEMEQRMGRSFGSMSNMDIKDLDALQLWAIAFLQVRREHPDVTWDEVGGMDITMADETPAIPLGESESSTPDNSNGKLSLGSA